ncbi:hypothetical protein [Embleya sp. NPDC001921]
MSTQDTPNTTPNTTSNEPFEISAEEMALLVPWMRAQLAAQAAQGRELENVDHCQAFSAILRRANRVYGTEPFTRDQCICLG